MAEAIRRRPASLLLDEETQLVSEGFSQKAVDDGVEAAVGEGRQVNDVAREGIVVPQRGRSPL